MAAKRCRPRLDEIHRTILCRQIVGDANNNPGLSFIGHADNGNDPGFDLPLTVVHEAAKVLWLYPVHCAGKHRDGSHGANRALVRGLPISTCSECNFLFRIRQFALELFALFKQRSKPARDLGGMNPQKICGLPKRRILNCQMVARRIRR